MEFRILGPLEIIHQGEQIRIRGRHHPKVLAVLLADVGRVVDQSRLVDTLWSDDPPNTAVRQVQNIVAHLRRQLGESAPPVEAVGTGYRLTVPSGRLDAAEFAADVRRAATLREKGDVAESFDLLGTGLARWRGAALAGLTGPVIEAVAQRLDEARLAALEEQIELALELGRHDRFIPILRDVSAEHPYRQRPIGQLMHALHLDGRTAEALEVFGQARRRLADDLGISPTEQLNRLHSAILRDDPGLRPRTAGTVEPQALRITPAQLPAAGSRFVGRSAELIRLDGCAADGRIAVISGPGGVGKSALAFQWGHSHRDDFPDGQLYVNLYGFSQRDPVKTRDVLTGFLRAMGVAESAIPPSESETLALYRSIMADRRMLVLLDNARDVEQVRNLLPGAGDNFVIVTSRHRMAGLSARDDAQLVPLLALNPNESTSLLSRTLGSHRTEREPEAADRLARLCGHLPLALRIAAAHLAGRPSDEIEAFTAQLESDDRLDLLSVDGDPEAAVAATFDSSFQLLSRDAQRLFLSVGLLPEALVCVAQLATATGRTESETEQILRELVNAHLVEVHHSGWYRMHDLIRLYARQKATTEVDATERENLTEGLFSWYERIAERYFDTSAFESVVAGYWEYREHPKVWRLCGVLKVGMNRGVGFSECRGISADGIAIADERNDPLALAHMWELRGTTDWMVSRTFEAVESGRKALRYAEISGQVAVVRMCSGNLGQMLYSDGRYEEAETHVRRSIDLISETDAPSIGANALNRLASIHRCLGRYAEAAAEARASIARYQQIPIPDVVARLTLARVYLDWGRLPQAEQEANTALMAREAMGGSRFEIQLRQVLTEVAYRSGSPEAARRQLYDIERLFGATTGGAVEESNLHWGAVLAALGEHEEALRRAKSVMTYFSGTSRTYAAAAAYCLATVHHAMGDHLAALAAARQARDFYRSVSAPLRWARSLALMASIHEALHRIDEARQCRDEANRLFRSIDVDETAQLNSPV
ncbi:DNA-binding SARP family transcriptional activator [Stackebrandtia endophytica]|uniref:DNA-binding SARP family transcriptional activator n=1 Tax=Stackebrandtia endophytica TaxID=1496996 RepID=A0A543AZJ4_9ACTN|nr:BTAD domain-containing putative transcriptional regulator [Stackebrandtia endophytica]TQL77998.1 DNA-binding SARP family transcriptional activator [Stackebrandtia endophytica]